MLAATHILRGVKSQFKTSFFVNLTSVLTTYYTKLVDFSRLTLEESIQSEMLKTCLVPWTSALAHRGIHGRCRIGTRDVVGYGINGSANYKDDPHFPFPSVRFKENTCDIVALRQKECGDWKMLCCEEKKALYRASFCQTFSEFQANTGLWKVVLGGICFTTSAAFWGCMFHHYYISEPLPESHSKESQMAQFRRMLEIHANPIDGLSSHWDYDYDRWKN